MRLVGFGIDLDIVRSGGMCEGSDFLNALQQQQLFSLRKLILVEGGRFISGKFIWVLIALLVLCVPVFGQANGVCEIRGQVVGTVDGVSNLVDNLFTWNPENFAGFYYDIKRNIGTENLAMRLTGQDNNLLPGDAPYGVTYKTAVQSEAYERALWGAFNVIGFQGDPYFAGYLQGTDEATGSNIFYEESTDKNSFSKEQLEKILMNSKDEMTLAAGTPLKLGEGYELEIKAIDSNGMYLELSKDGVAVDSKVISPSKPGATELDKTYFYTNPKVGDQSKLVTLGVHFKNALKIQNQTIATVDGIWQIADRPIKIKPATKYDKMTITGNNNGIIVMNNREERIVLTKNNEITLMPGVNIRTADNDTLRFYIYTEKQCQCE
jgi:S-layer protein (TIGR01567 family)